jgi:hypothetical protein
MTLWQRIIRPEPVALVAHGEAGEISEIFYTDPIQADFLLVLYP